MAEYQYHLYSERPIRLITDAIQTRLHSIKANKDNKELLPAERRTVQQLDIVLNAYICTKDNNKCIQDWENYFNLDTLSYNEALCLLLGINPIVSDIINNDLFSNTHESSLFNEPLSYILFKSIENSQLKRRFGTETINTH